MTGRSWAGAVEVAPGDVLDAASLPAALAGVEAAFYLVHSMGGPGDFAALDRQLAGKAGIADKGGIILQFYPTEASATLYDLEQKRAAGKQIRETVFLVARTGDGFVFSVEEQFYRQ